MQRNEENFSICAAGVGSFGNVFILKEPKARNKVFFAINT